MIRIYLKQDNSVELHFKTLVHCIGHTTENKKGLVDFLIKLGFDLDNTDKYIFISFDEVVSQIFDRSQPIAIIKTKFVGDFNSRKMDYEDEFGLVEKDIFELNIEDLKQLVNDI